MKISLLIIFTMIMIPIISESFAEELEIRFGQTIFYDGLKLYFYDIEDSRCPSDVTCIWEGKVSAMIHISNQTHKIGGPLELNFPVTYITPYKITLTDVRPHPISTTKPDYVAILEITKPEPDHFIPTDFEEINAENSSVMILIQSIGAILIVSLIIIYAVKKRKNRNDNN